MARSTWPTDPDGRTVAVGIDWKAASPLSFRAAPAIWKRVSQKDALALAEDPRYKAIFKTLEPDIQNIILDLAIKVDKKQELLKEDDHRESILREVDQVIKEAGDDNNITAKIQGIKLKAELFQLLTKKPQEDPQVTINVVTGVDRGAAPCP